MQALTDSTGHDPQGSLSEALFAAAPEAMFVIDASGTIRQANRRAEELFGFAPEALVGRCVDTLVPEPLIAAHARHRAGYERAPRRRPMGEGLELRGRRADGTEFPIDVALGPAEVAGEQLVVAIVRDITDRKLRQDELRFLSEHDALTGLLNRRGFDSHLKQAFAHARRHGVPTALILLDLDGFKLVNDRFGHLAGDRLLCAIAEELRRAIRAGDTLGRLGGDELAIIAPYATLAAAEAMARQLLDLVRDTATRSTAGEIHVTASIGVAPVGLTGDDPTDALAAADAAMYEAKRSGGHAVRTAAPVDLKTPS